jgi:hypothetical protein
MRLARLAHVGRLVCVGPLAAVALAVASCNGTTGDQLITFSAYASGVPGASKPFTVKDFQIQLTSVKMWIGAVYVNSAPPNPGSQGVSCTQPGLYVAQVPAGVEVDLLSTKPQEFGYYGNGTADVGLSGELWLTDGDVTSQTNPAPPNIVDLQAVATRLSDGAQFPFAATVTINASNRLLAPSQAGQPGINPICKRRIVQIAPIDIDFFQGGTLRVTVDPRQWFNVFQDVDLSQLPPVSSEQCQLDPTSDFGTAKYCIPDTDFATGPGCSTDCAAAGRNLFEGILTGGSEAYSMRYSP